MRLNTPLAFLKKTFLSDRQLMSIFFCYLLRCRRYVGCCGVQCENSSQRGRERERWEMNGKPFYTHVIFNSEITSKVLLFQMANNRVLFTNILKADIKCVSRQEARNLDAAISVEKLWVRRSKIPHD